ncbi:OLC1v1032623C1 [Oldenlandia corymbosa var. corymbosa]|uniref:OLC1v1032623C1 n=1 Tax=Oldenlandia corymbosa var. corymbosa TaxID=529605 RepID=A0AAV1CM57_OLDCO|nr:OLC1v1032623C1 [Oldenlandia corymbosa var. corymbosa]
MWRGEDYEFQAVGDKEAPDYGDGSSAITVKVHHGGGFARRNGYFGPHKIYFRDMSMKEYSGMRRLIGDRDLVDLIRLFSTDNPIVVLYSIGIHEPDTLPLDKPKPGEENPIAAEDRLEESNGDESDQVNEALINFVVEYVRASGWSTLQKPTEFVPYKLGDRVIDDSEDDCGSCSEGGLIHDSDDEGPRGKKYREFKLHLEMHNPSFELNQKFSSK